jgi:hypothetical protein
MARVPLSDAENLAVGAFGGIVETCVQSACDDRGEATARDGARRAMTVERRDVIDG